MSKYWEDFYKRFTETEPSGFAKWSVEKRFIKHKDFVLDLGCGNGRDTVFFDKHLHKVKGVDSAAQESNELYIVKANIEDYIKTHTCEFSVVYARFFFHSIPYELVKKILKWCSCRLVAEFRITGDKPLLYPDHTRHLVDLDAFIEDATALYNIVYCEHGKGIAPYKGEDPLVARIVMDRVTQWEPAAYLYSTIV